MKSIKEMLDKQAKVSELLNSLTDEIKYHHQIVDISILSEKTFAPWLCFKYKNNEVIMFNLNDTDKLNSFINELYKPFKREEYLNNLLK